MWRIGLVIFAFLVLTGSAFGHELVFGLQHRHDSTYYADQYRREFERARMNYTTTGDPKYMIPYLGWPHHHDRTRPTVVRYGTTHRGSRHR